MDWRKIKHTRCCNIFNLRSVIWTFIFNFVNINPFPIINEIILTFGSAFILYEGGREIKFRVLNEVKVSVGLLASLGVFITAVVVGVSAYYILKLPLDPSLLLGATVASTDPASLSGIIVSTKVQGYEVISSAVFMTIIITLLVQATTTKLVAQKLDVLED